MRHRARQLMFCIVLAGAATACAAERSTGPAVVPMASEAAQVMRVIAAREVEEVKAIVAREKGYQSYMTQGEIAKSTSRIDFWNGRLAAMRARADTTSSDYRDLVRGIMETGSAAKFPSHATTFDYGPGDFSAGTYTSIQAPVGISGTIDYPTDMNTGANKLAAHLTAYINGQVYTDSKQTEIESPGPWQKHLDATYLTQATNCQALGVTVTVTASTLHTATWSGIGLPGGGTTSQDIDLTTVGTQKTCTPLLIAVEVSPGSISVGASASAYGTIKNSDGSNSLQTCNWSFTSSSTSVATVSGSTISGVHAGSANIQGSCGIFQASAPIVVTSAEGCEGETMRIRHDPLRVVIGLQSGVSRSTSCGPCDDPLTPEVEQCGSGGPAEIVETSDYVGPGYPNGGTAWECERWLWTETQGGVVIGTYYTYENCHDVAM